MDQRLGGLMKGIRVARGIPQKRIGALLGVSFQQVQKYENGINRMSVGTFLTLCEALSQDPADLLAQVADDAPPGGRGSPEAELLLHSFREIPSPELRAQVVLLAKTLALGSRRACGKQAAD